MSWYISTANSFLERKILVGIQFMIWCWEVIRRFLSLKIPAPKLKRPQCSTAPRRPPVRAGPALLFTIFTRLTAFLWPLMLSGILQIDPFSVQFIHIYFIKVNCFLLSASVFCEQFDAWPISFGLFFWKLPTINCVSGQLWWVIIISCLDQSTISYRA